MTSWHINTSLNEEINDNTMKKEKKFSFPPIRFREFGTINTSTAYVLNYSIMLLWFSSRMSYNKISHLPIWRQSKNISWMSNNNRIYRFDSYYLLYEVYRYIHCNEKYFQLSLNTWYKRRFTYIRSQKLLNKMTVK